MRDLLQAYGFKARRAGRYGLADVIHDLPGFHLEVKRCEKLSMPAWIRQAEQDAASHDTSAVVWRRSNEAWRIDLPLEAFLTVAALAFHPDNVERLPVEGGEAGTSTSQVRGR